MAIAALAEAGGPPSSGSVSTLTTLFGLVVLVYYVLIWYVCILGLQQARTLFGASSRGNMGKPGARTALPLRHPGVPIPMSPPPTRTNAFAATTDGNGADAQAEAKHVGVSILRPLAGLDHNLASNLASAFEQRYPKHLFEVILSVADENDQALSVARTVCARYADVQSQIVVGDEACGVNPKICNLVKPYAHAKFDIVWVLDAQVQVSPYALSRAVQALNASSPRTPAPAWMQRKSHGDGRVGLAHHVPFGVTPVTTSMGSHVEAVFLSTNHAKMYLAINALSVDSCVMGKSNMYRKSDLARVPDSFFNVGSQGTRGEEGAIGSIAFERAADANPANSSFSQSVSRPLARFAIFLAEDNMLALSLWRKPLDLSHTLIAQDVARTSVGEVKSIGDYWKRRVRWIRVRRHMVPAATYLEPFTESIVCGSVATAAFVSCWLPMLGIDQTGIEGNYAGRNVLGVAFFFCHLLAWHLVDFAVLSNVQHGATADANFSPLLDFDNAHQVLKFRLAWLGRELLAFPIWLAALCGNTVTWRGRRYKILSDARAAHVGGQRSTRSQRTAAYDRLLDGDETAAM